MLERVIEKVSQSKLVNKIVVATPHSIPSSVPIFIGPEKDVLKRYYDCASFFGAEIVVRVTADCPMLDPKIIDYAILYYLSTDFPYVIFAPADGLDVEVFSFDLLREADVKAKDKSDREHVTPYMRRLTKCSVDTLDDLKKVRKLCGGKTRLSSW